MLTSSEKAQIIEFVKSKPIEVVYIFGSQATGKVMPLSDYDFAVLFDESISAHERFELKLDFIAFLSKLLKTDKVDVVDLNSAPLPFRYSAIKPRMDIYTRSKTKRDEFELKTFREFLDRVYYIKRHTQESLRLFAKHGL
ncbi:MAG: nucleotidyltransferase domain-containing protein [Patescibacteria group bacterium]